jgi:hypothetical protein
VNRHTGIRGITLAAIPAVIHKDPEFFEYDPNGARRGFRDAFFMLAHNSMKLIADCFVQGLPVSAR